MAYWLLKSEPETFSIDDLQNAPNQTTSWDGVRNYQARNFLKTMKRGDQAFFYHSSCKVPGIAGIVEIVNEARPEKNQADNPPRWFSVDVKLCRKISSVFSLDEMKKHSSLKNMIVLRKGNRLSVTPVQPEEWESILKLLI